MRDYSSLGALNTDGVPAAWSSFMQEQAEILKNDNRAIVMQRGAMNNFDYADAINKQKQHVAMLQGNVQKIKDYSEAYKDMLENDEFSNTLTAKQKANIRKIVELDGSPVMMNGKMMFLPSVDEDGTEYEMVDFNELPLMEGKEFEMHNKIEKDIIKLAEGAGEKGMFRDSKYYNQKLDNYFDSLNMSTKQAKSLAADFLGMMGEDGNFANIFADPELEMQDLDTDGDGEVDKDEYLEAIRTLALDENALIQEVKNQYKEVALVTSDNLKPEWERINKTQNNQSGLTSYQIHNIQEKAIENYNKEVSSNETIVNVQNRLVGDGGILDSLKTFDRTLVDKLIGLTGMTAGIIGEGKIQIGTKDGLGLQITKEMDPKAAVEAILVLLVRDRRITQEQMNSMLNNMRITNPSTPVGTVNEINTDFSNPITGTPSGTINTES